MDVGCVLHSTKPLFLSRIYADTQLYANDTYRRRTAATGKQGTHLLGAVLLDEFLEGLLAEGLAKLNLLSTDHGHHAPGGRDTQRNHLLVQHHLGTRTLYPKRMSRDEEVSGSRAGEGLAGHVIGR